MKDDSSYYQAKKKKDTVDSRSRKPELYVVAYWCLMLGRCMMGHKGHLKLEGIRGVKIQVKFNAAILRKLGGI